MTNWDLGIGHCLVIGHWSLVICHPHSMMILVRAALTSWSGLGVSLQVGVDILSRGQRDLGDHGAGVGGVGHDPAFGAVPPASIDVGRGDHRGSPLNAYLSALAAASL